MQKTKVKRVIWSSGFLLLVIAIVLIVLAIGDRSKNTIQTASGSTEQITLAASQTQAQTSTVVETSTVSPTLATATVAPTTSESSSKPTAKPTPQTTTIKPKPTTEATTTAPPKSYAGLLWYAIGDSITNAGLYPDVLVRNMGFRYYYNDGVPGTCMAVMADRVTPSRLATFDLVTVFAGTNDYGLGTPLGAAGDLATTDTFYGHVQKVIDKIRAAKPEVELVFLTPVKRGAYETQPVFPAANEAGFTLGDYRQAIKSVCAANGVKVIDLYANSGITLDNLSQYTSDNLHPNWDGAALIAQAIQRGLEH